jgi:hypothetical protein
MEVHAQASIYACNHRVYREPYVQKVTLGQVEILLLKTAIDLKLRHASHLARQMANLCRGTTTCSLSSPNSLTASSNCMYHSDSQKVTCVKDACSEGLSTWRRS